MEPSPSEQFLNRELQWLEFNRRVLFQAEDPSLPLLERLKFLGIFSSNLDEFVMKRVGGLKRQVDYGLAKTSHDGLSAADQLIKIRQYLVEDYERIARTYKNKIFTRAGGPPNSN
jgi:polyphosphate kinase